MTDLFQLTTTIPRTPDQDSAKLNKHDKEGCIDYVCAYMNSSHLLELEDEGISQLLFIEDIIDDMMHNHEQGEISPESGTNVAVPDANVSSP